MRHLTTVTAALCLFGVLVHVDGASVSFLATPATIEPLVTEQLSLTCRLDEGVSDDAGLTLAFSITITRNGDDVAMMTLYKEATTLDNTTAVASGNFTDEGKNGYLQLTWEYPEDDQAGHYSCHVAGTNRRGRVQSIDKQLDVGKKNLVPKLIGHINALQARVDKLAAKARVEPDVFFSALLAREGNAGTISKGETVIYDKVFVNKGHGYSARTGEFTCPVTGFYTFQLHGYAVNGKNFLLGLQLNGENVVSAISYGNEGHTGTSNTVTLKLTQGDVVKVVCTWGTSKLHYNHRGNTFSGRLISVNE